jgi:hypothetical protein
LGHDVEAAGQYERAVMGWNDYGHQLETGIALLGAGRCFGRLGDPRSQDRRARAEEILTGLQAEPTLAWRDR